MRRMVSRRVVVDEEVWMRRRRVQRRMKRIWACVFVTVIGVHHKTPVDRKIPPHSSSHKLVFSLLFVFISFCVVVYVSLEIRFCCHFANLILAHFSFSGGSHRVARV